MKALLLHPNFPGQFRSIAPALVAAGWEVVGVGQDTASVYAPPGVVLHRYKPAPFPLDTRYPPLETFANQLRQGRAAARVLGDLRESGFVPDVIVGHPGWGDMTFLERAWPGVPTIAYLEFFYRADSADAGFDPEFPINPAAREFMPVRNLVQLLAHQSADLCVAPTRWQRNLFPMPIRRSIHVMHEGVDTDVVTPDPAVTLTLPDGRTLTRETPVLTYCARNLEPYRGFHVFMRALPAIQRANPDVVTVIVGGDDVSYGQAPRGGGSWRSVMEAEVGGELDMRRVVFTGRIPYETYLSVLRVSAVHVYLTYPFILSWSMIEAMSAGCCIVGSDTPPVAEVLKEGRNGHLVPFFDRDALVERVTHLLASPRDRMQLGHRARAVAIARYDFNRVTFPAWRAVLEAAAMQKHAAEAEAEGAA